MFVAAGTSRGQVRSDLENLYYSKSVNITIYRETNPPSRVIQQLGLWDAGNSFIAAARAVTNLPISYRYNFTQMAQWNYMIDNAPTLIEAYGLALDLQARATCCEACSSDILAGMCSIKRGTNTHWLPK